MQEELRQAVARSLDSELIHPMAKRVGMKIQDLRRALWTINHSTGVLKGGEDMVSFYLIQREERLWRLEVYLRIFSRIRPGSLHAIRSGSNRHQIAIQPEDWVRGYENRALNYVL